MQPPEPGTGPAAPVTACTGGPGGRGAAVRGLGQGKEPGEEQRELRAGMEQGTAGHGGCQQPPRGAGDASPKAKT